MMTRVAAGDSSLAPAVEDTTTTLTDTFNATLVITAYAHALVNVVINPASSPPPDWYDTLNANLMTAQQHAQNWIDTIGPQVTATVPQTIIDYGNTFDPSIRAILDILQSSGNNPDAAQRQDILDVVNALLKQLGVEKKVIADVQAQLQAFATDIAQDNTNLQTGQDSAEKAIRDDNDTIQKIKDQISQLQTDMSQASTKATVSEIALGVGIFLAVAAFALAVATAGAALPLLVGVIAVLGVGGAIASSVVFSDQANADLERIGVLQGQLSDEGKQVAALTSIVQSVTSLVDQNEAAQEAMSSVLDMWNTLEDKLQGVLDDLQKAEDVSGVLQGIDIQSAQTAWDQLVSFAISIQAAASGVTIQPLITQHAAAS